MSPVACTQVFISSDVICFHFSISWMRIGYLTSFPACAPPPFHTLHHSYQGFYYDISGKPYFLLHCYFHSQLKFWPGTRVLCLLIFGSCCVYPCVLFCFCMSVIGNIPAATNMDNSRSLFTQTLPLLTQFLQYRVQCCVPYYCYILTYLNWLIHSFMDTNFFMLTYIHKCIHYAYIYGIFIQTYIFT